MLAIRQALRALPAAMGGGTMPLSRDGKKLREDPACRSGYEYAKRRDALWRGESEEVLRVLERAFRELHRLEGNGNSLGIALYLRELLAGEAGRGGERSKEG
ncbi:hypothetical protein [Anaeroselena agilis]|uniref:Uncharacterized protein n=1 Tax=Anaeroselena agilis TaxID=3063788 RepID=A0ABU3NVA5_9FIRM|nr:hypothetical protein [Selenomonadales bacterium 4137-cl]